MGNQQKKENIQIVHTIGGNLEQYKNYFLYLIDLLGWNFSFTIARTNFQFLWG